MIERHKLIESLVASTDSDHANVSFHLTVHSVRSYQVKVIFYESNWDSDVVNINNLGDLMVQDASFSRIESVRGHIEKFPTLFFDLNFIKLFFIQSMRTVH